MALRYIEDWLLFMGGAIDENGNTVSRYFDLPIKLASYDKRFISSICSGSITRQIGLTDRQTELAVKVITKYARQWQALGMDPSYLLTDDIPMRIPIRVIDRTTSITIENNDIVVKFPYHAELITEMHQATSSSCGKWEFNTADKTWTLALTEGNIYQLARLDNLSKVPFEIDPKIAELMEKSRSYAASKSVFPTLRYVNGKLELSNVPSQAYDSMMNLGWTPDTPDILYWLLMAFRHGIASDESVTESGYHLSDIIQQLLESNVKDIYNNSLYEVITYGTSTLPWADFDRLYQELSPRCNFVFLYRAQADINKIKSKLSKVFDNSEFMILTHSSDMEDLYSREWRDAVLVSDAVIGESALTKIGKKSLLSLYMIPNDEKLSNYYSLSKELINNAKL